MQMPATKTRGEGTTKTKATKRKARKTKYDYLVTDSQAILRGNEVYRRMKQQYNTQVERGVKAFRALLDTLPFNVAILCVNEDVRPFMLRAASFSGKSLKCYSEEAKIAAIGKLLKSLSGSVEEKKDKLANLLRINEGETRNGVVKNKFAKAGERKLVREILAALRRRGITYHVRREGDRVKSVSWAGRCLLFNFTPFTERNLDILLVAADGDAEARTLARAGASSWLAFGELKSGVDAAGADERWKTASGMIYRTRRKLRGYASVPIFFAARTIQRIMAKEIRADLKSSKLACAANMTKPDQRTDLADWLTGL